ERALAEQRAETAATRSAQVGTGDRAEKIRTYNYGERRVKDHRINLLSHNLDGILVGELDELTAALQDDEKRRRLEEKAVA
ncbi:MAG TPA: peptide chain release factor 1, partial [Solirubrobacteraceae bacterium]|nr:peptide chain release factor 1 [Solirubrobacteraceae bacterium]